MGCSSDSRNGNHEPAATLHRNSYISSFLTLCRRPVWSTGSHGRRTAFVLGDYISVRRLLFVTTTIPPYFFLHQCLHSSSRMRGNFTLLKLVPNFGDSYGIIPPFVAFTQPTLTTYTLHHIDWVKGTHTTRNLSARTCSHSGVIEIREGSGGTTVLPSLTHMHTLCTCSFE